MSYSPLEARGRVALQLEHLEDRCVPAASDYVTGLYVNLLNRIPQPNEVAFWVGALRSGTSAQQVAQNFTTSTEFRLNLIGNSYVDFLGRQPTTAEVNGWLNLFQAGLQPEQFAAAVFASDEYVFQLGVNPVSWLSGVYLEVFNRLPDAVGLNTWLTALQFGASRLDVTLAITDSQEAHANIVVGAYRQLLGRLPDTTGLTTWVSALDQGMTLAQLLAGIASSPEYINRTAQGSLADPVAVPQPVTVTPPVTRPLVPPDGSFLRDDTDPLRPILETL